MRTTITARHCEISEDMRQRALAVLARLAPLANRPVDGTVVFDIVAQQATAEIRIHDSSGELFVASGEGKDHRSALDRAEEKVRRQLEKEKDADSPRRNRGLRDAV